MIRNPLVEQWKRLRPLFYSAMRLNHFFFCEKTHITDIRENVMTKHFLLSIVCKCKVLQVRKGKWNHFGVLLVWTFIWKNVSLNVDLQGSAVLQQASTSQLCLSNCSGGNNLSASEFQLELCAVEMVRVSSCWQASLVSFAHYPAPSAVHRLSGFSITLPICHRWFFFALCVHIFSGCLTVAWHQPLRKWIFFCLK